ncbi:hypothetical protein D9M72_486020 [compost metagenome]
MGAEVSSRISPQLRPELFQSRRDRTVLGHRRRRNDGPVQAVTGGTDAEPLVGLSHLARHLRELARRRGHLHLAEEPLGSGGLAGEADAEQSAHQAASAVAPDQPA